MEKEGPSFKTKGLEQIMKFFKRVVVSQIPLPEGEKVACILPPPKQCAKINLSLGDFTKLRLNSLMQTFQTIGIS